MIRKFISEVILLLAIISSLCAFLKKLITTRIRDKNAYIATTLDKEKRLTELPFNKLIFVGGSNLTFGLDCKKISDSIKMPTVNMSVHAGLGLDFMLKETMASIKQGDVIILSPEYYLGKDGDRKLFAQLLDINPQASKYVINTFNDNIRLLVAELQRCVSGLFYTFITNPSPSVYEKNNFTEEGDMVGHLEIANSTSFQEEGKCLFLTIIMKLYQ